MTEYTEVTDWATIATGQKVRATRDGEHLEFTVTTKAVNSGVTLRSSQSIVQICTYDRPVWVLEVEKVAVVVPDVPGAYLDNRGTAWTLADGHWACGARWRTPEGVAIFAPFTRLRPEAEVVAEVLAEFRPVFHGSRVVQGNRDMIADIYGVTL